MSTDNVIIERDGPLAVVTVNRPKALNALNAAVLAELETAVLTLESEPGVRVVAVTGAGDKAFVAGADIAEMKDMGPVQARAFAEAGGRVGAAIETSAKVYVAAVNGFALGGGCELALACDFLYAAKTARFGQPEVKLGVIPGFGGTQRLARRVGIAKTKELVFTGDVIGADEAARIGLVDAVCEPAELMDRVRAVAGRIAANGPLAVAEAKRVIHQGLRMTQDDGCQLEALAFASLFATADQSEGMDAFLAKRPAQLKGE